MITLFKDPLFNTLDRVFDNAYNQTSSYKQTNIIKNEEDWTIQLAVPGLTKEDIKISVKDGNLHISYERPKEDYSVFVSSFNRVYELPNDTDEKNITGSVEDGVLEIILPKSKKKLNERFISLN